jgi:hypothetical protein
MSGPTEGVVCVHVDCFDTEDEDMTGECAGNNVCTESEHDEDAIVYTQACERDDGCAADNAIVQPLPIDHEDRDAGMSSGWSARSCALSACSPSHDRLRRRLKPVQDSPPATDLPSLSQTSLTLSQEEHVFGQGMSRERALYRLGRGRSALLNIPSMDCDIKLRVEAAEQSDDDFQGQSTRMQEVSASAAGMLACTPVTRYT